MRKLGAAVITAAVLAGCAQPPKMLWLLADGQSVRQNPVYMTQYELDATACLGERNRASLSGVTIAQGGFAGVAAAMERGAAADTVQRGCMAEKGYLLVPEDQADAKLADLAAIAAEKRRQEAVASSPPPVRSQRKQNVKAGPAS